MLSTSGRILFKAVLRHKPALITPGSWCKMSTMKAIRVSSFGGPEVLKVESNVPVPKPGPHEILVKVAASGVNPVETYIRTGTHTVKPELPYTPGSDAAGTVEAVGSEVTRFKKGDRVFTVRAVTGTYAEYAVAEEGKANLLDDRLSFEDGAALGVPYYTAYRSLVHRAACKPGESVLVHGASGGVGLACVQIAKAMGLTVLGTAGTPEGLTLVRDSGADAVFCHRDQEYAQKIMEASGGGVDVVMEMLSNVNLQRDLEIVKPGGRIVVIGCRGTIEINPRLTMGKECTVTGVMLPLASPAEWKEMHAAIGAGMRQGWVRPHVGTVYPLADAPKAHHDIIHNTGTTGKLILKI